jgi:Ni/Co efflux regulator RcnB
MKKLLTMIVPLVMLIAFASIGMAQEATQSEQELNQELNSDINGEVDRDADPARGESTGVEDDDSAFNDDELNNTNSRESRSIANKRGRQPRRGSTASELSEVQKYWGDHNSGKSADEDGDEDEDDDITPV